MAYNRFYLMIILRVILIMITSLTISFYAILPGRLFTLVFFIIILGIQVVEMIHYINLTNREISSFLAWLRGRDPLLNTGKLNSHKTFRDIGFAIEQIRSEMEKSRREMYLQSYYINKVLEKVIVGIISFDSSGIIGLYNPEAARLFCVKRPANIRMLDEVNPGISDILVRLKPGQPESMQLRFNDELVPVSLNVDVFREEGEQFSVVSVNNMGRVLDEKEMEAWQKLIRVLRHEIMNSVTPITTLTVAMKRKLQKNTSLAGGIIDDPELSKELMTSINLIEDRGNGLIQFVDRYRDITNLPDPRFEELHVGKLITKTGGLFREECRERSVELDIQIPGEELIIKADASMVEQVMINLIKNSMLAVEKKDGGYIGISAGTDSGQVIIRVKDNGKGIPLEIMDKIFIPFFTTRHDGSGIGLSLARQIMRLHGGTISAYSTPGEETLFNLRFPVML